MYAQEAEMAGTQGSDAVRAQLERILASRSFARSPRVSRLLRFVVEQKLQGGVMKLKEYALGIEVFGRDESFDPRIDSIVRVEARRLRSKLDQYYRIDGAGDALRIVFSKGCYVPAFLPSNHPDLDPSGNGILPELPDVHGIRNLDALPPYARGRQALRRWSVYGMAKAVSSFGQALEHDDGCAGAHAGLASAWMASAILGFVPARDVVPKARASAERALAIAPGCSEAFSVLGMAAALFDWDWNTAETQFRRAIHSDPSDLRARLGYALVLTLTGRFDDALEHTARAQRAHPASVASHMTAGLAQHLSGAHDQALICYRLAQDLEPSLALIDTVTGWLMTERGMYGPAVETLCGIGAVPLDGLRIAMLAYCYAKAGEHARSEELLTEMASCAKNQYVCPVIQAMAYCAAGQQETAWRRLDDAIEDHSPWLPIVRWAEAFAGLRENSRFPDLLRRINM